MKARSLIPALLLTGLFLCPGALCLAESSSPDTTATTEQRKTDLSELKVLDLKTAGKIALERNPSFKAAFIRVKQAKARVSQASSAYWPRLDASASFSRVTLSDDDYATNLAYARLFDRSATLDDSEDYYSAGISASWVLFNGFERYFTRQAALFGEKQSEFARDDVKRLLLSSVAETYFAAQLALENIKISEADKAFNQRLFDDAKARSMQGAGSLSDEMNFEIRVNTAEQELIRARQSYTSVMFGLAALLAMPNAIFPGQVTLSELQPETEAELARVDMESLIQYAMSNRSDIRQSEAALDAAMVDVKRTRATYYPSIGLSAAYEGTRTDDMGFENDDFGNSIGVNVTYNLFSGGGDRARIGEAVNRQKELRHVLEALKIEVISSVRTSVEALRIAQQDLVLSRSNAALVKRNRDLVETEYGAGRATLVRLNEAQRDMITAQSRLALSLVTLRKAWFDLEATTGKISERFKEGRG